MTLLELASSGNHLAEGMWLLGPEAQAGSGPAYLPKSVTCLTCFVGALPLFKNSVTPAAHCRWRADPHLPHPGKLRSPGAVRGWVGPCKAKHRHGQPPCPRTEGGRAEAPSKGRRVHGHTCHCKRHSPAPAPSNPVPMRTLLGGAPHPGSLCTPGSRAAPGPSPVTHLPGRVGAGSPTLALLPVLPAPPLPEFPPSPIWISLGCWR